MAFSSPTSVTDSAKPEFKVVAYNAVTAARNRYRNLPCANRIVLDDGADSERLVNEMITQADFELTPDIVSIRTEKGFQPGQAAGTFILTLVDKVNLTTRPIASRSGERFFSWIAALNTNDIVFIAMNDGGPTDKWNAVMIGLIDRIGRVVEVQGERGLRRLNISGRDLGKWFLNSRVDFLLQTIGKYGLTAEQKKGNTQVGFEPDRESLAAFHGSAPKSITDALTTGIMPHHMGIARVVKPNISPTTRFEEENWDPIPVGTMDSTAWELLEQHAFRPWCELWCDTTRQGNFTLNFRRTPFDITDWRGLQTWDIPLHLIQSMNIGFGDHERINFITVEPTIMGDASELRLMPLFTRMDLPSIGVHGLLPHRYRTRYFNFNRLNAIPVIGEPKDSYTTWINDSQNRLAMVEAETSTFHSAHSTHFARKLNDQESRLVERGFSWAGTLWSWFFGQHLLQNGNITCKGMSGIKVGERVAVPSKKTNTILTPNLIFYVMGITQQFNYPDDFKTTLVVNRGETDAGTARRIEDLTNNPQFNGVQAVFDAHRGIIERQTIHLQGERIHVQPFGGNWANDRVIKEHGNAVFVTPLIPEIDTKKVGR